MGKLCFSIVAFMMGAHLAFADQFVIGVGLDDVQPRYGTPARAAVLEYHFDPIWSGQRAEGGVVLALQVDTDRDLYVGSGLGGRYYTSSNWFVEGSTMFGLYEKGPGGTFLGSNFQFRTLIGVGYEFADGKRISLAVDHKSNANLARRNPGSETLSLRYASPF